MSEIPIGTPPTPPGRHAAPSGWYPDPAAGDQEQSGQERSGQERYWDGWQWTRNTRSVQSARPSGGFPSAIQSGGPPAYGEHPTQQPYGQQPYGQQPYGQGIQNFSGYAPAAARQQQVTADGVPLAGWWWRVLSVVIDFFLLRIVVTLVTAPLWIPMARALMSWYREVFRATSVGAPVPPLDPAVLGSSNLLLPLIGAAAALLYNGLFWQYRRATLGQLATGLRVVPLDQGRFDGQLGWNRAFLRALVWALPGVYSLLRLFQLLDALWALWQPRRQCLHDLAAGTQVVKVK